MVGIGQFRNRVQLIKNDVLDDSVGGGIDVQSDIKIWASVKRLSGNRVLESGQPSNLKTYEITTHKYLDFDIEEGDQIKYKNETITIKVVKDHPKNYMLLQMEGTAK